MSSIDAAAAALAMVRRGGEPLADLAPPPATDAEAYAIQHALFATMGWRPGAWKAGVSPDGTKGAAAPIADIHVHASPARLDAALCPLRGIEGEIAFRLARDLPARDGAYARDEVLAAVAEVVVAIEEVETRFRDMDQVGALSKLADCQSNGALVAGGGVAPVLTGDLGRARVRLTVDGKTCHEGVGGHPSVDPLAPLLWLANNSATKAILRAGQVVTTGSMTGLVKVGPAAHVVVEIDGIGRAELRFS
jgi:2-keto-4-pentenoate hydratase